MVVCSNQNGMLVDLVKVCKFASITNCCCPFRIEWLTIFSTHRSLILHHRGVRPRLQGLSRYSNGQRTGCCEDWKRYSYVIFMNDHRVTEKTLIAQDFCCSSLLSSLVPGTVARALATCCILSRRVVSHKQSSTSPVLVAHSASLQLLLLHEFRTI